MAWPSGSCFGVRAPNEDVREKCTPDADHELPPGCRRERLRLIKATVVGLGVLALLCLVLTACGGLAPIARTATQSSSPCATTGQSAANSYAQEGAATLIAAYSSTASGVASWQVSRVPNNGGDTSNGISGLAGDTPVAVCYYSGAYGGFPEPPPVPGATPLPQPYYHYLVLEVAGTTVIIDSVSPTPPSFGPPPVVRPTPTASSPTSGTPSSSSPTPSPQPSSSPASAAEPSSAIAPTQSSSCNPRLLRRPWGAQLLMAQRCVSFAARDLGARKV